MYQSLVSPINVRQNLWTLSLFWNLWVSIQLFVLSKCTPVSLSGFPENLGLKWDQFNGSMCSMSCCSACGAWGTWGAWGAGGAVGSRVPSGIGGARGPSGSAIIPLS